MQNPRKALEALVDPAPLTLGQIALLDYLKLPILDGKIDDVNETLKALWLLSMPLADAVEFASDMRGAILWAETIGTDEYNRRLVEALDGIAAFFGMLPRDEADVKKKTSSPSPVSAMATSPSSVNASAEPTAGRSGRFSMICRLFRRRSSTGATRKDRGR